MKACISLAVAVFLCQDTSWGAEEVIPAKIIEERMLLWDSQTVRTQDDDLKLAAYKGWVYLQDGNEGDYRKIVPGNCPQWIPRHKGQTDRWFYVFLPVGFDGLSEIWTASTDGNYLGKAAEGMFQVNSTPVLSPDGKTLATVLRPLTTAQGDWSFVTVINMRLGDRVKSSQDFIYKAHNVDIRDLCFENEARLRFTVIHEGGRRESQAVSLPLQPDGAANGSQPIPSGTNQPPSAAGSRR
jgi:hypothetical protein